MTPFLNFFRPLFVHSVGGVFPRCARGRECTPHSICGFMHPPLLFLSAKEKEERRARCRRKRGPFAFGLHSNPDRCRASFRKALLLLRAPPESRCGRETMCFYPSAPKWAEPLRFRKGNAFDKQGCPVGKVFRYSKFPLWRAFRMRLLSLSAATPLVKQYLLRKLNGRGILHFLLIDCVLPTERQRRRCGNACERTSKLLHWQCLETHLFAAALSVAKPLHALFSLHRARHVSFFSREKRNGGRNRPPARAAGGKSLFFGRRKRRGGCKRIPLTQ